MLMPEAGLFLAQYSTGVNGINGMQRELTGSQKKAID
jgi:hypothetical protein